MEDKKLISVVVPVYNVEKYLKACVDSIINQTYSNLEIILVDDGSTDESGKLCDKYLDVDRRIKVIHKKNGGLADARNTGMKYAKGEYIGFVDSDDYIHPEFYENLHRMITKENANIAECEFLRIDVQDIERAKEILDEQNSKQSEKIVVESNINCLRELYGLRLKPYIKKVVVWNKLYERSLFNKIQFPVGKLHEDEFTTYKILFSCSKLVSTNKALHGYMQTKNSIMRKAIKPQRINDNLQAYEDAAKFFAENKNTEIEHKVLRRYLENCIELSGKVFKEQSEDKKIKLDTILSLFNKYYDSSINNIKSNVADERENEIINLIDEAYLDRAYDFINPKYWEILEKIINKP